MHAQLSKFCTSAISINVFLLLIDGQFCVSGLPANRCFWTSQCTNTSGMPAIIPGLPRSASVKDFKNNILSYTQLAIYLLHDAANKRCGGIYKSFPTTLPLAAKKSCMQLAIKMDT